MLGSSRQALGRYPEAGTALREAIRLDPQDAHAHNVLGSVLFSAGHDAEAEGAYRGAIRIDPCVRAAGAGHRHIRLAYTRTVDAPVQDGLNLGAIVPGKYERVEDRMQRGSVTTLGED